MLNNEILRRLIREQKDRIGISWEEAAAKAGVSVSSIYKFVYGQTNAMTLDSYAAVLDALGLELAVLNKESGRKY